MWKNFFNSSFSFAALHLLFLELQIANADRIVCTQAGSSMFLFVLEHSGQRGLEHCKELEIWIGLLVMTKLLRWVRQIFFIKMQTKYSKHPAGLRFFYAVGPFSNDIERLRNSITISAFRGSHSIIRSLYHITNVKSREEASNYLVLPPSN